MPRVSASRTIAARQEDVWAALADIAKAGRWNKAWSRIEVTSADPVGAGTTFRAHTEDGEAYDFEITHWAAPDYIAFAPIRRESERYAIALESHAFLLRPEGQGHTRVELIASARARGLRGRFIGLLFWPGYQKHGLDSALDSLQAIFEPPDGAEPETEASSPTD